MKIQDEMPPEWGDWYKPKKTQYGELPIVRLKPREEICECGDPVVDRCVSMTYVLVRKGSNQRFCSRVCQNCLKWHNPQTNRWESVETTHYNTRKAIIQEFLKQKAK